MQLFQFRYDTIKINDFYCYSDLHGVFSNQPIFELCLQVYKSRKCLLAQASFFESYCCCWVCDFKSFCGLWHPNRRKIWLVLKYHACLNLQHWSEVRKALLPNDMALLAYQLISGGFGGLREVERGPPDDVIVIPWYYCYNWKCNGDAWNKTWWNHFKFGIQNRQSYNKNVHTSWWKDETKLQMHVNWQGDSFKRWTQGDLLSRLSTRSTLQLVHTQGIFYATQLTLY